jgi:hypothetical protein
MTGARRDPRGSGGYSGRRGKKEVEAPKERCKFRETDEKLCKKLEELDIKPKELDGEYGPRFDTYVDDVDCN